MVSAFFAKKVHFLSPKHTSRCFTNKFSQESFDGDSFVSQSKFDAYAIIQSNRHLFCFRFSSHSEFEVKEKSGNFTAHVRTGTLSPSSQNRCWNLTRERGRVARQDVSQVAQNGHHMGSFCCLKHWDSCKGLPSCFLM